MLEFGIVISSDLVAATGDGAPVMVKFGYLSDFEYLQCMNHGIHLAVIETVFKKITPETVTIEDSDVDSSNLSSLSDNSTDASSEASNQSHNSDDDSEQDYVPAGAYGETVSRMRKVVILFKGSPTSNAILQKIIKTNCGKNLQLLLDVKTRWNSLVKSAKRFQEVEDSIVEALAHKKIGKAELWNSQDSKTLKVDTQNYAFT